MLDAVEVTQHLGEQYLWVDRLCIDQPNLQEKQFLISKMDAIHDGAEFTIVAAAGDASTGLPGVMMTPRIPQPRVELKARSQTTDSATLTNPAGSTPDAVCQLLGITKEEYEETGNDQRWLDPHRHGLRSLNKIDMSELLKDEDILKRCKISREHLRVLQDFADDYEHPIEEWMIKMEQMAQKKRIPLQDLVPYLLRETAIRAGIPEDATTDMTFIPPKPTTCSSKTERPLPPSAIAGRTILISTLEDPRITIRNSEWATRGWTYQEGVLSNRRLVFIKHHVYWECRGMATNESLDLPLTHFNDASGTRMADYILSGIFDGDLHRVPELQYDFTTSKVNESSEQVLKLDSHIRAFTGRKLSHASDSLNAFPGVAARYSTDDSLCLLLGMPVWAGLFANKIPGLQHTFALSLSTWTHAAQRVAENVEMYAANCPRRTQFPSWTWAGWEGRAGFGTITAEGEDEDDDEDDDELSQWDINSHIDILDVMTSKV